MNRVFHSSNHSKIEIVLGCSEYSCKVKYYIFVLFKGKLNKKFTPKSNGRSRTAKQTITRGLEHLKMFIKLIITNNTFFLLVTTPSTTETTTSIGNNYV